MRTLLLLSVVVVPLTASAADGQPSPVESRLKDYYASIAKNDGALAESHFYPDSPRAERAKVEFSEFTQQFDLSYEISEVKEVGRVDDDVVISFVEKRTFAVVGSRKLNTFTAKVLMVWRKDKSGAYKIWDSRALNPAKAENADGQRRHAEFGATGMWINDRKRPDEPLRTGMVWSNSPADKAGIQSDLFLIAVNGTNVVTKSAAEASSMVRGPVGAAVVLEVSDVARTKTNKFTVKRGRAVMRDNRVVEIVE